MNRILWRRFRGILLALLVSVCAAFGVHTAVSEVPWLGQIELRLSPNAVIPASPNILLVTTQEGTMRKLGIERRTITLPRKELAKLLRSLSKAGAKAVLLDFDFQEESDEEETQALVDAIAEAAPTRIILGQVPEKDFQSLVADQTEILKVADTLAPAPATAFAPSYVVPGIRPPHVAVGSHIPWNADHTLRGIIVQYRDTETDEILPHVAVCAAMALRDEPLPIGPIPFDPERFEFRVPPYVWHVTPELEYRSRWTARRAAFPKLEFTEAIQAATQNPDQFRGKLVLVGSELDLKDSFETEGLGRIWGVEANAQFVNSLIAPPSAQANLSSRGLNLAWAILLAFGGATLVGSLRPLFALIGFTVGVGVALVLPYAFLNFFGVRMEVLTPILATLLSMGVVGTLGGISKRRFDPVSGRQPGKPVEAVILFVDLQGSTAAISDLDLQETRRMLGDVLDTLVVAVKETGGRIERTMGDGVLAMWFRPKAAPWSLRPAPNSHVEGCLAAIRRLDSEVHKLDARTQSQFSRASALTTGVELGTIVGDLVGPRGEEHWSWYGIPIHLAARLQSACGTLGISLALGPKFVAHLPPEVSAEFVKTLELKGISGETPIYTLKP